MTIHKHCDGCGAPLQLIDQWRDLPSGIRAFNGWKAMDLRPGKWGQHACSVNEGSTEHANG